MLFNSIGFLLFFPAICILYWLVKSVCGKYAVPAGNITLLAGSYYFYMCWKPEYALLLLGSTLITYLGSIGISRCRTHRAAKALLVTVLAANLLELFFFKYFNFAAETVTAVMKAFGVHIAINGLDVLLPVGISFYIFQALGYSIDVYRGAKPEKNLFTYALFVSFFPQLVAGPIERSDNLLPQFHRNNRFDYDYAMSGLRLMLWGYMLKLCLADRAAEYVNMVFNNIDSIPSGTSSVVAAVLFTLQIYGDFAGYSFIAIGSARILGFSLNANFRRPYFSATVTEFWHRWHISLSRWLRDYLYIPLGGSRTDRKWKVYRNIIITFAVSGLWHGANFTFVVWGLMHGAAQCVERALGWNKRAFAGLEKVAHVFLTLVFVCLAWVVFRADTFDQAVKIFANMADLHNFSLASYKVLLGMVALTSAIIFSVEFLQEKGTTIIPRKHAIATNYLIPIAMTVYILIFGNLLGGEQFIYFQF